MRYLVKIRLDIRIDYPVAARFEPFRTFPAAPDGRSSGAGARPKSLKFASNKGSMTIFTAACTTRLVMTGMPSGRFTPSAFGI